MNRLLLALAICLFLGACARAPVVPMHKPVMIQRTPEDVYARALEELKLLLAPGTKIIREDDDTGLVFRFSVKSSRRDLVRFVEVRAHRQDNGRSKIAVHSEKFSFTGKAAREQADADLEERVISFLK